PPELARLAARALVGEPGAERMRHFLALCRQLFLERGKDLALEFVVTQLPLGEARIPRAVGERASDRAGHAAEERERHRRGVGLAPQLVREELQRLGDVPLAD